MDRRKFMALISGGTVAALSPIAAAKRRLVATTTAVKVPVDGEPREDVDARYMQQFISHSLTRDMSLKLRGEGKLTYKDINRTMGECFALFGSMLKGPAILGVELRPSGGTVTFVCDFTHHLNIPERVFNIPFRFLGCPGAPIFAISYGNSKGNYEISGGEQHDTVDLSDS